MPDRIDHVPTIADAEHEHFEDEEPSAEAAGISSLLFWLFAIGALAVLPIATQSGRRDLGWFMEPWSWPLIVLIVAILGGAILPLRLLPLRRLPGFGSRAREAFVGMDRALLYSGMFLVYLLGVTWIGFTI